LSHLKPGFSRWKVVMYDEFFAKAHELVQRGEPFVTAIVVRSEKPTSGKPGDKAIITADGVMHGWIGGSCAQPTVIKEALKVLTTDEARLVRLSPDPQAQTPREGLADLPMTCYSGGTMEIYIEPQQPRPRLLIVGDLPVAQALAHLGAAMNYHVVAVAVDGDGMGMSHADEVLTALDEIAAQIRPFTFVVVATHGNYDELALEKILTANPSYVGLVASPTRARAVRDYLVGQGLSENDLLPLKAPAGLDIQARRGDEIALSIMAEIVQSRRNAEMLNLELFQKRADSRSISLEMVGHQALAGQQAETAIDPICLMTVDIATAKYISEFEGDFYYFCCPGCKTKFEENPSAYTVETAGQSGHPAHQ
jgi:xanthine dehydrogenase accessory factor